MACILAIDPGVTGALAFYFPEAANSMAVYDMPIMNGDVDPHQLHRLIKNHQPDRAIIERVSPMPKEGVSSVWRFSAAFTTACVVVKLLQIPLTLVPPSQWKRSMNLKGGKEGKEQAIERAVELFPLVAHNFTRKKDHGRAEAALLAVYVQTKLEETNFNARLSPPLPKQS